MGYNIRMNVAIRKKARELRLKGQTYAEINRELKLSVPKSTFSYWFRDLLLPPVAVERIASVSSANLRRGQKIMLANKVKSREMRIKILHSRNKSLYQLFIKNIHAKKIALAILYLAEGSKTNRSSIMFGNSNPPTVKLFVSLLRSCFKIEESKFRATVQCRADQNTDELQRFWSRITAIPARQFYKAHIDKRSVGKPTQKPNYKGVCRIDYFSAAIDFELKCLANEIEKIEIS